MAKKKKTFDIETITVAGKEHRRIKDNIFYSGVLIFFLMLFGLSIYQIVKWQVDNTYVEEITNSLLDKITINEIVTKEEEVFESDFIAIGETSPEPAEPEKKEDLYWKYKEVSLIDVDIDALKQENDDTVAWIQVPGTNINYPVVQSSDNDYYLKHDYLKKYNTGGWIFLDYRNDIDDLMRNNIIYGHRRYNESMFGSLKNVLNEDWLNDRDQHIIKISGAKYSYLFEVFSVYSTPNEGYYLQTTFTSDEQYAGWLETIVERSEYDFGIEMTHEDKILTLSTCHGKSDRLAVHAKLIKIVSK